MPDDHGGNGTALEWHEVSRDLWVADAPGGQYLIRTDGERHSAFFVMAGGGVLPITRNSRDLEVLKGHCERDARRRVQ